MRGTGRLARGLLGGKPFGALALAVIMKVHGSTHFRYKQAGARFGAPPKARRILDLSAAGMLGNGAPAMSHPNM